MPRSPLGKLHHRYQQLLAQSENIAGSDLEESLAYFCTDLRMAMIDESELLVINRTRRVRWLLNVRRLEAFIDREGRWPRQNCRAPIGTISTEERELAAWVRTQRAHESARCDYQASRLECVPGFEWEPRTAHYSKRLREYENFLKAHGRSPRSTSTSALERSLARWKYRQQVKPSDGVE